MAGPEEFWAPNGLQTPPSKLPLHAKELPVSAKIASLQGEVFLPLNSVNTTMASLEAGRVRKGKNFSAYTGSGWRGTTGRGSLWIPPGYRSDPGNARCREQVAGVHYICL